jgi:hypothetical protein
VRMPRPLSLLNTSSSRGGGHYRLTLYSSILITMEEKLLNTRHIKTFELIGAGMAITDATLDTARRDEKELAAALKELEHLHHLEKYDQDSM